MVAVLLNFGLAAIGAQPYISTFVSPAIPQQRPLEAGVPGLTRPNRGRQPAGTPLEDRRSHGRWADEFHNLSAPPPTEASLTRSLDSPPRG